MEINMVPSQFLSVVLEDTERSKGSVTSSSESSSSLPKYENNCDDRFKTDCDKESLKRRHSIIEVGLTEQEKRDLTARLPKALLAECTVEIHTTPPRQRRALKPRFDAKVSPIYSAPPKDRTRYNDLNIPGLEIRRETTLNLSGSNYKLPPNKLCSTSSSFSSKDYIQKYNPEATQYTSTNAHDALQLIEAVYSDHDDDDSNSREDILSSAHNPTNGERKIPRPVPNLIEVNPAARVNLISSQSFRNPVNPSLKPPTNFFDVFSNMESLRTRDAFANLPRSMLMANESPILKSIVAASEQKFSFKCEHCPNVYPNRGALWQHSVATHSVEKTCECNICGRKFYRNCSLALHLKSHSEEEYCTCKECGKSFTRLINLERHMKVHSVSPNRYQCDHCDKSFPDRANLLRHSVCHGAASSQSRTHQCDTCGKSYKSKDHLEIHWQATHAAISCSMCAKSFTSYSELARHESTVHPDRPGQRYSCEHCGKSYSEKAVLRKHLISHTGERLRCSTCGIEFTQRSSLLRHVKRMHVKGQEGVVHGYVQEALLGNENLRKLVGLDISRTSTIEHLQEKSKIVIDRMSSSGYSKFNSNHGILAESKEIRANSLEITKTSNRVGEMQNEFSCENTLTNSSALLENFLNSNSAKRFLWNPRINQLSAYNDKNVTDQFLKHLGTLSAPLNSNRNALLMRQFLTASNRIALGEFHQPIYYGTTIEAEPTSRLPNDVSVSQENSLDGSLEENEDEDYSEETEDEEGEEKESSGSSQVGEKRVVEVNNYVADINDNEDSDNDNFVIDEDAIEDNEEYESSTDADTMSNKND